MTATNHALTGALVAAVVKEPAAAIPLAFLAHFVMDALPHFGISEPDDFKRSRNRKFVYILVGDLVLAAVLVLSVPFLLHAVVPLWLTFLCMVACMSPDLVWGWHFYFAVRHRQIRPRKWFSRFHAWIQWGEIERGIYIELAWFILVAYSVLLIRSR